MYRFTVRIAVASLAFVAGVAATALWFIHLNSRVEPINELSCQWLSSSDNASHNRFPSDIYYPVGVFSADKALDEDTARNYSSRLAAMHEPSLVALNDAAVEAYRFLWLRSFHPKVAIRLWACGKDHCISVKQLGQLVPSPADGGYMFDDTLTVNENRALSEDEWNRFKELIEKADFWRMPSRNEGPLAYDGAWWVMEGYRNWGYHVVDRQSPDNGAYYEACVYLIKISGIHVDENKHELY
jgi:hypothetical protein